MKAKAVKSMGFALETCARGSLALKKNYQEVEHEKDWEEIQGSYGKKNPMFMDLNFSSWSSLVAHLVKGLPSAGVIISVL